jgi:tRNA(fMet)-specific endonuclease VapC
MGALIDSSVLIAAERGRLDLDTALAAGPDEPVGIAAITASELLHGTHRLSGVRLMQARAFVELWLGVLPVVPFDLQSAQVHAALAAELGRKGTPMGAHDLMIAATAVQLGYAVATCDRRSFRRVDGLAVQYW